VANPQHDGLRNAAANVTIISPFYDAGLPVEYAANGFWCMGNIFPISP